MYHSLIFCDGDIELYTAEEAEALGDPSLEGMVKGKNTWADWLLIPATKPAIPYPPIDTNYVTVAGMSGTIDSSEMVTGDRDSSDAYSGVSVTDAKRFGDLEIYNNLGDIKKQRAIQHITFSNRTGELDFYVNNMDPRYTDWINIRRSIAAFLNGKRLKMFLEDEPGYYYEGRFTFPTWKTESNFSHVSIKYTLDPFRYPIKYTVDGRETYSNPYWDPFNFETDYFDQSASGEILDVDQDYIDRLKAGVL